MSNEAIHNWVEKAKMLGAPIDVPSEGIQIIRRKDQSRGNLIMEISELLRPWISKMFEGVRDENQMLVQPARVRGIALNVAQKMVNDQFGAEG